MKSLKQTLAAPVHLARDLATLIAGIGVYRKTGSTPLSAHTSLIHLHCRTAGRASDFFHGMLAALHRPYALPSAEGVLGQMNRQELAGIVHSLNQNGYHVFSSRLPEEVCAQLEAFSLATSCAPHPMRAGLPERARYDWEHPLAETYQVEEQELVNAPAVQALMADASLLAVAQSYLGSQPVLDAVNMWWSALFSRQASSDAAQLYHFDLERLKWVKFFFYLTDVTTGRGPHCYVAGSHKRGGQPAPC